MPSHTAHRVVLQVYHHCLISRYPVASRRPVVFWRGSTTDPKRPSFGIQVVDKVLPRCAGRLAATQPGGDVPKHRTLAKQLRSRASLLARWLAW